MSRVRLRRPTGVASGRRTTVGRAVRRATDARGVKSVASAIARDGRPNDRNAERSADRPPRKEKVADPNSPFAALAALKASLEQQKKK